MCGAARERGLRGHGRHRCRRARNARNTRYCRVPREIRSPSAPTNRGAVGDQAANPPVLGGRDFGARHYPVMVVLAGGQWNSLDLCGWRYCRHCGVRAQRRAARRQSGRARSRHRQRSAHLYVAARSVRHDSDSAVGRAARVEADPAQAFDQPAPAEHRTVAGSGDEPVLARRPHVVAVRADVRRGGCACRAAVALVALASRRYLRRMSSAPIVGQGFLRHRSRRVRRRGGWRMPATSG